MGKLKNEQHSITTTTTALFKIEMHCQGCADKIRYSARQIEGVERVRAIWEANKLVVMGTFDPCELREKLAVKTKKRIVIVSSESDKEKCLKKLEEDDSEQKEAPVTTATLKLELHCRGCIARIDKVVSRTKGVEDVAIERQKDLVIVKGKMDVKALIESLEQKMKRKVGVVTETDVKEDGDDGGGVVTDANRLDYVAVDPDYVAVDPVLEYGYGCGYGYGNEEFIEQHLPPPQMFSDENPNACSIM